MEIQNDSLGSLQNISNNGQKTPIEKKRMVMIILGIVLAGAVVLGIGYFFNKRTGGFLLKPIPFDKDAKNEKTIQHPITGVMYSEEEAAPWINIRPLAVMLNNHTDARPQSGLIYADVVYEVVAEGGITRFLPFYLTETPEKIGPVRSTREYYLVLVKELGDAMLMHIGWSPQALEDMETWPVRSLGRGGGTFWRDDSRNVAFEHTAYTNGVELREIGDSLGWQGKRDFDSWKFKEDKEKYPNAATANKITVDFWYPGDYSAIWDYDVQNNVYLRSMGYDSADNPIAHVDNETKEQISAKNLIVQFVVESSVSGDDKSRLTYELVGSGDGLVFIDGKVIKVTWSKAGRDERTKFYDLDGNEMEFNRGKFWVSIVPDRNVDQVVYE